MAVAPVANFRFYDSIYEERYMGLPEQNEEAYRLGSPITHARGLKGNLLVVHGTGDDNVHYQGTEALINELVACKKRFTMMAYPNRTHSISEEKNTTYHLYSLLTRYLNENLPVRNTHTTHAPAVSRNE
jgi:dipeptidyl-peptidase-4